MLEWVGVGLPRRGSGVRPPGPPILLSLTHNSAADWRGGRPVADVSSRCGVLSASRTTALAALAVATTTKRRTYAAKMWVKQSNPGGR